MGLPLERTTTQTSSGTSAKATTSDTAVELIAANDHRAWTHVRIVNEGSVAGFYSTDGGTTWHRLPAETSVEDRNLHVRNAAIQMKRVSGGSDLSSVYASAWA